MARYSFKNILGELRIWVANFIIGYIPSTSIRHFYYKYVMKYELAKGSTILLGCKFNCKGNFKLGKNSTINQFCHLDNRGGIVIGNNVSISPYVALITADHDLYSEYCEGRQSPIIIEDYVFIGFRAIVLQGATLKYGSAIASGAIVTKSTESRGIYAGIPAKKINYRKIEFNYSSEYNRLFH